MSITHYLIKPGDTLASIASKHGFYDFRDIYNHSSNGEFRSRHPNPNLIYHGDWINIPETGRKPSKRTFDASFKALPPRLQMQLWVLALDAGTSNVNLAYRTDTFTTSLSYPYGGNIQAAFAIQRFTASVAVEPGSGHARVAVGYGQFETGGSTRGSLDLSVVFRGFKFGASADVVKKSVGLELSYGASLLPFPEELAETFNCAANGGLPNLVNDIARAPNNPLAWYRLHSGDVSVVSKAIKTVQHIAETTKEPRFGGNLRINYNEASGLTIYGAGQYRF